MELDTLLRPGNYIAGAFDCPAQPDGELRIHSPADFADLCAIHPYARSGLQAAVAAARSAWPGWRRLRIEDRADFLRRFQARLRAHHAELTRCIAREVGKPLWEAKTEVDAMVAKVDLTLGEGRRFTDDVSLPDLPGEIRHRPLGVVAVIGPFNFPGHLPNGHIVPALLLGNCVVHKPSEKTPSAGTWLARCFHEAGLPPGVFNLVQGPGELGALLSSHPEVDGLMFTGSSSVGRRILASQTDRMDRLIALELGGKNASIALDDCDVERTARAVAFSAFVTAGQRCTATSRLIATRAVARALIERIAGIAAKTRVGYPLAQDGEPVFMGPVIDEAARARLLAAQAAAHAAGFQSVAAGGACDVAGHAGHYVRPAVHVAPGPDTVVPGYTDTELFGPDLSVYAVDSAEQAFALANTGWSGLTASVFTASRERFEDALDVLRVGVLQWNRASAGASSRLPFGGIRESGNHRPAGIFAGLACSYAQGVQRPAANEALASWPGFGV